MAGGLEIELDVFGTRVVRRRMLRFADAAEDMRPAWDDVAAILEGATRRNFQTRGVSGGSRWRDLNEDYAEATGRRPGERILRLSDRLYDSLTNPQHAEHVFESEPDSMRWGSRVPYGKFHQSLRPRRKIPYRPPVRLSENAKRGVTRAIQRRIVAAGERSPAGVANARLAARLSA
jgi:phage gpG-like protein